MVGILNGGGDPFGVGNINTNQLLYDNIRALTAERFRERLDDVSRRTEESRAAVQSQDDRLISVKASINNASIAVESGFESIEKARADLLELREAVAAAGTTGNDIEFEALQFDTLVSGINNEADSLGPGFNLVGNLNPIDFSRAEIEYRAGLGLEQTTLQGTYIGNDFRITINDGGAFDGNVLVPDLGSDTIELRTELQGVVQDYTTDGGEVIDFRATLRSGFDVTAYDPATGTISIDITVAGGETPVSVTGIIENTGTGLYGSWFYDYLASPAGRDAAFEAIDQAEVQLTLAEAELEISRGLVQADSNRIDQELDALSAQSTEIQLRELEEQQQLQIEAQTQLDALNRNLDAALQQQTYYRQAFASFINTSAFPAFVNIQA